MNEKVLKTLEYHKILGQLTEYAFSDEAKSLCRSLRPVTDRAVIERLQQETSDALGRILRNGTLSFSGVRSLADSLARLKIGGTLSTTELLRICSLLEAGGPKPFRGRIPVAPAGKYRSRKT